MWSTYNNSPQQYSPYATSSLNNPLVPDSYFDLRNGIDPPLTSSSRYGARNPTFTRFNSSAYNSTFNGNYSNSNSFFGNTARGSSQSDNRFSLSSTRGVNPDPTLLANGRAFLQKRVRLLLFVFALLGTSVFWFYWKYIHSKLFRKSSTQEAEEFTKKYEALMNQLFTPKQKKKQQLESGDKRSEEEEDESLNEYSFLGNRLRFSKATAQQPAAVLSAAADDSTQQFDKRIQEVIRQIQKEQTVAFEDSKKPKGGTSSSSEKQDKKETETEGPNTRSPRQRVTGKQLSTELKLHLIDSMNHRQLMEEYKQLIEEDKKKKQKANQQPIDLQEGEAPEPQVNFMDLYRRKVAGVIQDYVKEKQKASAGEGEIKSKEKQQEVSEEDIANEMTYKERETAEQFNTILNALCTDLQKRKQ